MDLNDALRRVVVRHLPLVVVCVLTAVGLSLLSHRGEAKAYVSAARVAVGTEAARSSQEAAAQTAQVEAIATSRSVVARAITAAGVDRSPEFTAQERIKVRGLGTSPVARVTVQDSDPRVARSLAGALAQQVVIVLDRPRTALEQARDALQGQIDLLRRQRTQVLVGSGPLMSPKESAALAGLDQQISSLGDRVASVETQRGNSFDPGIVDEAGPAVLFPSPRVPDAALAGVLGLVLGLGLAGSWESLRPSVLGGDALARLFSAPVLSGVADKAALPLSIQSLATRIDIAARRSHINVVALAGPLPEHQLADLAQELDELLTVAGVRGGDEPASRTSMAVSPSLAASSSAYHHSLPKGSLLVEPAAALPSAQVVRVLPCDERTLTRLGRRGDKRVGVLVIAPTSSTRNALRPSMDVVQATGWPVIGVAAVVPSHLTPVRDRIRRITRAARLGAARHETPR